MPLAVPTLSITPIEAPKLDPGVAYWLDSWRPSASTLHWSKAGGGCFYDDPLTSLAMAGHELSPEKVAAFIERQRLDFLDRGIKDDEVLSKMFNELAPDPQGERKDDNLWDHLHFGACAMLDGIHSRGYQWGGEYLTRLVWSYYNNANTPWMRDAGLSAKYALYGDRGRPRTSGWIVHALLKALRCYERAKKPEEVAKVGALLEFHVAAIGAAMPMIDDPQTDSPLDPTVKHHRIFMIAILLAAMRRVYIRMPSPQVKSICDGLAEIIVAARRGVATYVYDLAVDLDGKPYVHPNEGKAGTITDGVAGVGIWLVDAMKWESFPLHLRGEMVQDAINRGWPKKEPVLFSCFVK